MVEDHLVARLGIVTLIGSQSDLVVCGEAESGQRAIQLHRELKPDLTIVDMRLPDMDGDVVIAKIREEFPSAYCMCLSTFDGEAEITRAVRAGALAYLAKDTSSTELLEAIRVTAGGSRYWPPGLAARIADYATHEQMSSREIDVLRMVARGLANKEVAAELNISEETVKSHIRNVFSKLGVSDRTGAVVRAVELGLIRLSRPSSPQN